MNESIESIVTEMRERADAMQTHGTTHGVRLAVLEFARRIEAAWKREARAIATENVVLPAVCITKPSGNAAAMREALLNIQEYAAAMDVDDGNVLAILDACRDALSAPPRNCDVGTAEEQNNRYEHYCFTHRTMERCCQDCPIKDEPCCELAWAQMPYEAEGGAK